MGRSNTLRIVILVATLLMGACGELTPPEERQGSYAPSNSDSYTVRPGDTLYSIAWGAGLDTREVADWNNISPPYTIYPGQRILLTGPARSRPAPPPGKVVQPAAAKPPSTTSKAAPPKSSNRKSSKSTRKSVPRSAVTRGSQLKQRRPPSPPTATQSAKVPTVPLPEVEKAAPSPNNHNSGWAWPTRGKVVNRFDASGGKKGIDIGGRAGQEIFTAAAGDVVYSGSGLLGYGNLVIIKHDDTYLSAYGHNSQLLVKEGDKVATGQKIAEMGVSPKEGAILHFEIRRDGKPVDPLAYLPR